MKLFSLTNILTTGATVSAATGGGTLVYLQTTNAHNAPNQNISTISDLTKQIENITKQNSRLAQQTEALDKLQEEKIQTQLNIEIIEKSITDTAASIENWKILINESKAKKSTLELQKPDKEAAITKAKYEHRTQQELLTQQEEEIKALEESFVQKQTLFNHALEAKHNAETNLFIHQTDLVKDTVALNVISAKVLSFTKLDQEHKKETQKQQSLIDDKQKEITEKEHEIQTKITTYLSSLDPVKTQEKTTLEEQKRDLYNLVVENISDVALKKEISDSHNLLIQMKNIKSTLEDKLAEMRKAEAKTADDPKTEAQKHTDAKANNDALSTKTTELKSAATQAKSDYDIKKSEFDDCGQSRQKAKIELLTLKHDLGIKKLGWDIAEAAQAQLLSEIASEDKNTKDLIHQQDQAKQKLTQQQALQSNVASKLLQYQNTINQQQQTIQNQ